MHKQYLLNGLLLTSVLTLSLYVENQKQDLIQDESKISRGIASELVSANESEIDEEIPGVDSSESSVSSTDSSTSSTLVVENSIVLSVSSSAESISSSEMKITSFTANSATSSGSSVSSTKIDVNVTLKTEKEDSKIKKDEEEKSDKKEEKEMTLADVIAELKILKEAMTNQQYAMSQFIQNDHSEYFRSLYLSQRTNPFLPNYSPWPSFFQEPVMPNYYQDFGYQRSLGYQDQYLEDYRRPYQQDQKFGAPYKYNWGNDLQNRRPSSLGFEGPLMQFNHFQAL